jgi:hypothetical protein
MLISYYEDGKPVPHRLSWPLVVLMVVNIVFALLTLFAWTFLSLLVAKPLAWATWMQISRGYGLTDVFDYPFVILWLLPLLGVCGAWIGAKAGRATIAYAFVAVPVTTLLLVFSWYYLAPPDWR